MASASLQQAAAGPAPVVQWLRSHAPAHAHLRLDSRTVEPGDVFVAVAGRRTNGAAYVGAALARGAAALLTDAGKDAGSEVARDAAYEAAHEGDCAAAQVGDPDRDHDGSGATALPVPALAVHGLRPALGAIAAAYYGNPTAQLRTIGITGTNGKTSSCVWIAQVLESAGIRCATLGTLGFGFPGTVCADESPLTTPDALSVQRLARAALDQGAARLAMEVSSIGLDQGRVDGVHFEVALFTNLTRDHLDYHPDMAAYAAAKRKLFLWPGLRDAVLNLDDAFGRELAAELAQLPPGQRPAVIGVATQRAMSTAVADLPLDMRIEAHDIEHRGDGLRFTVACRHGAVVETRVLDTALLGDFNVANLLGVVGVALACGVALDDAVAACARLQAPPGRLQRVASESVPAGTQGAVAIDEPLAVVDYAHTPDAIGKALLALRPVARARQGRLWIVFGAGGDRDRGKRPAMAAAAAAAADAIVLTSDNPRSEDAAAIIDEIAGGMPAGFAFLRHVDRGAGIRAALHAAAAPDVVLIAGKGHENYQEVAGQRLPFSDVATARAALRERTDAAA